MPEQQKRYAYSTEDDLILSMRAEDLAVLQGSGEDEEQMMLRVRMAGFEFAIHQSTVLQIISPLSFIPVPFSESFIRGITHVHGAFVAVLDVPMLLNAPKQQHIQPTHAVLVDADPSPYCIALDQAPDSCIIFQQNLTDRELPANDWASPVIDGLFMFENTLIGIISIPRLSAHHHLRELIGAEKKGE